MSTLEVEVDALGRSNELYYEDVGNGFPVVLIHGWPLDHTMWEAQCAALNGNGCRVIAYDRRGFGQSSHLQGGYNYNRFADDLAALLESLDLRDVTLVGYSMGVGEVVRYMTRHLGQRVSRLALVSGVAPSLMHSHDNPDGLEESAFQGMMADIRNDRCAYAEKFVDQLFDSGDKSIASDARKAWVRAQINDASTEAMLACVQLFQETDFTDEIRSILNVPTLIVHGDADHIIPASVSSKRMAEMLPGCVLRTYKDAPHGLFATHAEELNTDLLELIRTPPMVTLPVATN